MEKEKGKERRWQDATDERESKEKGSFPVILYGGGNLGRREEERRVWVGAEEECIYFLGFSGRLLE